MSIVIFLSVLREFLQPSTRILLVFLQDIPVIGIIAAFFIAWVGCWLPLVAILAKVLNWRLEQPFPPEQKIPLLVSLYLLAPLIIWGFAGLGIESLADYGLVGDISILGSLLLGFTLGLSSLGVVFAGQFLLGWCAWQKSNIHLIPGVLLPISLVALFVGGIEELVFRGFLLTNLERDYSIWSAAIVSSLIFSLLHLIWEQKETIPQLPGLALMGMVLAWARVVDGGSLGLAWGLHSGWVWAIALIDTAELISYPGQVSEWLTGKNKKPLAGLVGIICILLTGAILYIYQAYVFTE
jgi:membrane protease YdiL (CAAX protease family)